MIFLLVLPGIQRVRTPGLYGGGDSAQRAVRVRSRTFARVCGRRGGAGARRLGAGGDHAAPRARAHRHHRLRAARTTARYVPYFTALHHIHMDISVGNSFTATFLTNTGNNFVFRNISILYWHLEVTVNDVPIIMTLICFIWYYVINLAKGSSKKNEERRVQATMRRMVSVNANGFISNLTPLAFAEPVLRTTTKIHFT